jgi:hypothetical protein
MCYLKVDDCITLGWVHIYRGSSLETLAEGATSGADGLITWGRSDCQGQQRRETQPSEP